MTADDVRVTPWSAHVRAGVAAAVDAVAAPSDFTWSWFLTGSCGRGEALSGADVETLMVVDGDLTAAHAAARTVHTRLVADGLRIDDNGATASHPRCARTLPQWQTAIDGWLADPAADRGVVMTGLLADAAPIAEVPDDVDLAAVLRARLDVDPGRALTAMLDDLLVVREVVPSRLRLLAGGRDRVDVKRAVLDPITKIGRWAALSAGSSARTTVDRLGDAPAELLSADDASALAQCWTSATRLRSAAHAAARAGGGDASDLLVLSDLAPQDRATLRGIGRELTGIGRVLSYTRPTVRGSR